MKRTSLAMILGLALTGCAGALAEAAPPKPQAAFARSPFISDRITVEMRGPASGPDVILIPGLASSRAVWERTAAVLDDTHRVHLVQVNGFAGQPAGANAEGPVFGPLVGELARYMESQRLHRPAVIGHSMGGALGLALAAERPETVGRIMTVDSLPFFSLLMGPATTPESVKPRADAMRDAMLSATPEQQAASAPMILAGLVKNPAGRERGVLESVASDKRVVARAVHDIMTTDLRPALAGNKVPITALYAFDAETGAPAAMFDGLWTSAYRTIPAVKLVRVDGARHFIMDDQPERFAAEVRAFLSQP